MNNDVLRFIKDIRDPNKFLEYCRKYHENEPRDITYVASRNIISRNPENISFILAASKIIIVTWNIAGFQRLPRKVKDNLEKDILEAYNKCREKLKELKGKRLESLDLSGTIKNNILYIYQEFSSKKSIGYTGASKVLHILNPNVFMMWDTKIRENYHKLHAKNHKISSPECYLDFLKQSQEIIRAILSKRSENDLWSIHKTFLDKNFIESFSFKENMLKMLDECNYVRFKLNIRL